MARGKSASEGAVVAKIIELVGSSPKSFDDAVKNAAAEASRTLHGLRGIKVTDMTALLDGGRIKEYRATCKISFGVER